MSSLSIPQHSLFPCLHTPPETVSSGKIVHIYTHRGGYKAGKEVGALEFLGSGRLLIISFYGCSQCILYSAFVPRRFRSLRRISMVRDYWYYECLSFITTIDFSRTSFKGG